ncbi:MAG: tRNA glutamyl-Q(34) synthetase GluQRS [Planktomarina sp.]
MRTRFAPSPTGPLHLGHAFSAIIAHDFARNLGGEFIVRIEDLDQSRVRPHWEAQIFDDLAWLGLTWEPHVMRQSDRSLAYSAALDTLWAKSLIFPCGCNRRDVMAAAIAPQEGDIPPMGPDGVIYPGTCRSEAMGPRPEGKTLRLNMASASTDHGKSLQFSFKEISPDNENKVRSFNSQHAIQSIGDVVVSRRDMIAAYHLAVVVDDAAQDITHVVRGNDLHDATDIHVVLQHCLNLPTPIYFHHKLVRDENGKRLAKRDNSKAISKFRSEGATPEDIRRMVGL